METSLYENLPALEAAAQEVHPELDRLRKHGEQTERSAQALLESIEEHREEVDALEKDVEAALTALARDAAAGEARVSHGVEEVAAASDALQRELHETEQEVASASRAAEEALDALEARMRSAGEEAEQAEDRVTAAIASLGESLREGESTLHAAVEGVAAEAGALEAEVDQAREMLATSANALTARLARMLEAGRGRVAGSIAVLENLAHRHTALLQELSDTIDKQTEVIIEQTAVRLERGMGVMSSEAFGPAGNAVILLSGDANIAFAAVTGEMHTVSQAYDVLRGKVGPLQAGVANVREAAAKVGLAWP